MPIDLMPLGKRKTVDEDQDRRRIEDDTSIEIIVRSDTAGYINRYWWRKENEKERRKDVGGGECIYTQGCCSGNSLSALIFT